MLISVIKQINSFSCSFHINYKHDVLLKFTIFTNKYCHQNKRMLRFIVLQEHVETLLLHSMCAKVLLSKSRVFDLYAGVKLQIFLYLKNNTDIVFFGTWIMAESFLQKRPFLHMRSLKHWPKPCLGKNMPLETIFSKSLINLIYFWYSTKLHYFTPRRV